MTEDEHFMALMQTVAQMVDGGLNGRAGERTVAFAIVLAPFGEKPVGRVNFISNADRADMIAMMQEYIDIEKARVAAEAAAATIKH